MRRHLKIVAVGITALLLVVGTIMPVHAEEIEEGGTVPEGVFTETESEWDDNDYTDPENEIPKAPPTREEVQKMKEEGLIVSNSSSQTTSDETEESTVIITVQVPKGFNDNILVELYNRQTGKTIQVPVYKVNGWVAKPSIPSGEYMVMTAFASNDDIFSPEWVFETGEKFEVRADGSPSIYIRSLTEDGYLPDEEAEVVPENPNTEVPEQDVPKQETENQKDSETEGVTDTYIDGEEDEELLPETERPGYVFLNIVKTLVTGPNFFLLLSLVGVGVAYYFIKKKRDE